MGMPGTYDCTDGTNTKCALTADTGTNADSTKVVAATVDDFVKIGATSYGAYKWGVSNCKRAGTAATASVQTATTLCRYDMNGFRAKITFKKNPGDINELTCDADLVTTPEHKDSAAPSTDISCTSSDSLDFQLGGIGKVDGSTIGGGNGGQLITNMNLRPMMTHGDRIKISSDIYTIAGPITAPSATKAAAII